MGKAIQWFKSLFGKNKGKEKKEIPISAVLCQNPATIPPNITEAEAAWLTAADVAVAAVEAAVKVRDGLFVSRAEHLAAIKIQSYFRGYLARKALKGLRAVVKIQALMRGILVRKQAKATLLGMEALIRVQNIVRAKKNQSRYKKFDQFHQNYHAQKVKERSEHIITSHSKRLSYSFDTKMSPFDEKPMVVEVGLARPKSRFRRPNNSVSDSNDYLFCPIRYNNPSRLSAPNFRTSQGPSWALTGDEYHFSSAHNTPHFVHGPKQFLNGSYGSVTPVNSVCGSDDVFRRYMADTHSFRAKLRCQSAPRQRPDVRLKKRQSLIDLMESRNSYSGVRMQRSCSKAQDVVQFKSAVMCKLDRSCDSSRKEERVRFSRRKS